MVYITKTYSVTTPNYKNINKFYIRKATQTSLDTPIIVSMGFHMTVTGTLHNVSIEIS